MLRFLLAIALAQVSLSQSGGADQPQWGAAWSRNMVSGERGLPATFDPATGKNIRWKARLGTETHSTPMVASGKVFIGTNNGEPRDPAHTADSGVLMCFAEGTGKFIWQLVVPKREEDPYYDWPKSGMSSPVTVESNRVYVVSNRGEVICLDMEGMANGNDGPFQDEALHMLPATNRSERVLPVSDKDADILWMLDLPTAAGIWPHDAAHSSILIHGRYLYLNSGTGVDHTHRKIRTPDAPGLVVVDKTTGRYVARDFEKTAPDVFHSTWSSPSLGKIADRDVVFFAGGNGIVYAFEPVDPAKVSPDKLGKLKRVWEFDFDPGAPKGEVHRFTGNRSVGPSDIFGMPVFLDGKLFVAGGGDLWWGKNEAWLKCLTPGPEGDAAVNWTFGLEKHVMSTVAVSGDLLFIADCGRNLYCLDRGSGRLHWRHELQGEIWASPLVADGKVFLGTRRGDFWTFRASREKTVLNMVEFHKPISATATAANGCLYIATMTDLYAVAEAAAGN